MFMNTDTGYTPGWRQTSWVYSSTLVYSVRSLYISCYVFNNSNKLVLSYLLLRLLPQNRYNGMVGGYCDVAVGKEGLG